MTRNDITRMAREAGATPYTNRHYPNRPVHSFMPEQLERFAALVAAAEREACADKAGEFARKWWSIHCSCNKHMETTRKAHDDFCALQAAIRARGQE